MLTHLAGIFEGDGSFTIRRPFWDGVRNHVALTRPLPMSAMSPSTVQSNIRMKPRKAAKPGHYMTSSTRPGIRITRRLRGPGSDNNSLALTTTGILPLSSSSSSSPPPNDMSSRGLHQKKWNDIRWFQILFTVG
jgi:hypothetical protein